MCLCMPLQQRTDSRLNRDYIIYCVQRVLIVVVIVIVGTTATAVLIVMGVIVLALWALYGFKVVYSYFPQLNSLNNRDVYIGQRLTHKIYLEPYAVH